MKTVEYRVRPVTRYIVTEFHTDDATNSRLGKSGVRTVGEFESEIRAAEIASALESKALADGHKVVRAE